jgi:hypothetical protein
MPRLEGVLRNKGAQARVPVPLKGKFKRAGGMPALQGKRLTTRMDAMRNFVRGHLLSCLGVPPACAKATAWHATKSSDGPPALKLRRGMGGTGGEDGRAGTRLR